MKQFFKYVFATIVGIIISFLLFILLNVIIFSAIISMAGSEKVTVSNNTVLRLTLQDPIPDRTLNNPFRFSLAGSMSPSKSIGLLETLDLIEQAKEDANIKGIYLDMSYVGSGMATIEEVRNALLDFKKSGKFIYAYGEVYTQSAYYIASVADKIFINPLGSVDFKGLTGQVMFMKGALNKLDINMQVIRHGKFKSAVEPFTLDEMSEENRQQYQVFMGSIWNHMLRNISNARSISENNLNMVADSLLLYTADEALQYKFVDQVVYKDELLDIFKEKLGLEKKEKIPFMSLAKYSNASKTKKGGFSKDKIAIVYALGDITGGEGNDETIGSDRISRALRQARSDSAVKAIVFRINSPGGSALASDVILREVNLAKKVKPVVVSMGDYAASGGYYIACGADSIIANPTTLTGSIGVFGIMPDMSNFFKNKLGLTFDEVTTNKHSDFPAVTRAMTDYERQVMTRSVEQIYTTFLTHVSNGRDMTTAQVDSIGQGRIWSGMNGKQLDLVDATGGIKDAIKTAARMAGLENYRLTGLPTPIDPLEQLMNNLKGDYEEVRLKSQLKEFYPYFREFKSMSEMKGVQARLFFHPDIK